MPTRKKSTRGSGTRKAVTRARAAVTKRPAAAKEEVAWTNEQKVFFPDKGYTKGDLLRYYEAVAPELLAALRDRPVTLERLPDGAGEGKPRFWQKNTPTYYPKWVERVRLPTEEGREVDYALVNDERTLMYLANQGAVTFHVWLSRVGSLDVPDHVLFDLDPGERPFADAVKVAREIHKVLDKLGVPATPKTSGKSGLHVLADWPAEVGGFDAAREWALKVAGVVVATLPDIATTERMIKARGGRLYLDVMQNARGKHVVPPWVVRATPAGTVSMPLAWDEVNGRLKPGRFDLKSAVKRVGT